MPSNCKNVPSELSLAGVCTWPREKLAFLLKHSTVAKKVNLRALSVSVFLIKLTLVSLEKRGGGGEQEKNPPPSAISLIKRVNGAWPTVEESHYVSLQHDQSRRRNVTVGSISLPGSWSTLSPGDN